HRRQRRPRGRGGTVRSRPPPACRRACPGRFAAPAAGAPGLHQRVRERDAADAPAPPCCRPACCGPLPLGPQPAARVAAGPRHPGRDFKRSLTCRPTQGLEPARTTRAGSPSPRRVAYAGEVTAGSTELSASRVANVAAPAILEAFEGCQEAFNAITRRARSRFELRDWKGAAADATERLDLYGGAIDEIEAGVRTVLGARVTDRPLWAGMKAVYSGLIAGRAGWGLAGTLFKSATRRLVL